MYKTISFLILAVVLLQFRCEAANSILLRNGTTVAGQNTLSGFDDGAALTVAKLSGPTCVLYVPQTKSVLIGDTTVIRNMTNNIVTTIFGIANQAGTVDGNKTVAQVNSPSAFRQMNGKYYFTEPLSNVLRCIDGSNIVTVAGVVGATSAQDGIGTNATFQQPSGIGIGIDGALYIADRGSNSIRRFNTTSAEVTTVVSGVLVPSDVVGLGEMLYVINRPTGGSTIGVYRYNITSGVGEQWIASTQPFVSLGSDRENKRLFGATQNRIYEIYMNATLFLYAGTGSSFSNGVNPTFRSINNIFVVNYRAMYLATGTSAYLIRGLFFDPPSPIELQLTLSWPNVYFPFDNATEMASIMTMIQQIINTNLNVSALPDGSPSTDVSPLATVTGFIFNATTNEITFTVAVPNMTYTNTTNQTVQNTAAYQSQLTARISQYYSASALNISVDYWTIPVSNASAMGQLRALLEKDLQTALVYDYVHLTDYSSTSTQTSAFAAWNLLVPPSFKNSTTNAILASLQTPQWTPTALDLYPLTSAFLAQYYVPNVAVTLGSRFVLPLHQPQIMYAIRNALRQDVASALGIQVATVGNYAPPNVDSTYYKILVPRVAGMSNTTILSMLSNSTFANVQAAINAAYPTVAAATFDGLLLPWSDPTAMEAIRNILIANLSGTFGTNSTSAELFLMSQNFTVTGATGWQNASISVVGRPSITSAQMQAAVLAAQQDPALQAYLTNYYQGTSSTLSVSLPQITTPISDPAAMEILRHLIAQDLAAALGINNTGANTSSPVFSFGTQNPATGATLPALSFPSTLSNVTFPLLFPATSVNSSTAALIAQAIAAGLPSVQNFLKQYYNATNSSSATPGISVSSTTPLTNATAMEEIRRLLVEQLREQLNATLGNRSTDAILASVNVLPYDPVTNTFPLSIPAYLTQPPLSVNLNTLVSNTNTTFLATDLPQYVQTYYGRTFSVQLPYDITPWSNDTTMTALFQTYLTADVRNKLRAAYPQTAPLTDAQLPILLRQSPSVSKVNSTVTWELLLPPSPFGTSNGTLTQTVLSNDTLPLANEFLLQYFRKDLFIVLSANDIPIYNATVLQRISVLLRNQLATNLNFENVGVNGTQYVASDDSVYFKIIVPPQWSITNNSLRNVTGNLTRLSNDLNATTGLTDLVSSSFAPDISVFFVAGYLPETNTTAMTDIQALLRQDVEEIFKFRPIGVASYNNYTNPLTEQRFNTFDLRMPLSFANGTTTAFLVNSTYPRVVAYLNRNFPPPTPAAVFNYSVPWPVTIMPTGNDTRMALLRAALIQDAMDALGTTNVSGFPYRLSDDGQNVIYDILLPNELNNVQTGVLLENARWPRFQQLLASFNQGNLQGGGGATGAQSVDEGCSRGCVIAVAAIGATIVTAGVIAAIVLTSKRKRLATVVASNGAHKNTEGRPPAPAFTPVFDDQAASPAKNPLEMP